MKTAVQISLVAEQPSLPRCPTLAFRLHHVRDRTHDENRFCVTVGNLPQNLARLTSPAISIVRSQARFCPKPIVTMPLDFRKLSIPS